MLTTQEKATPEWLSSALQGSVINKMTTVKSVQSRVLTGGLMADTLGLELSYANGTGEEPLRVVAKFPSSNPDSRKSGFELGVYEREILFYQRVASSLNMRVPHCYLADFDQADGDFALILEDLNPAVVPGNAMHNCRILAEMALTELAKLHTSTWNLSNELSLSKIPVYHQRPFLDTVLHSAREGWKILQPFTEGKTSEENHKTIEIILNSAEQWLAIPNQPSCVVHGDFRFANLMLTENDDLVTLDWQTYMWANPCMDVAHFITASLTPEQQKDWAEDLQQHYYQQLRQQGVNHYRPEQFAIDYRIGMLCELVMVLWTVYSVGANGLADAARNQMLNALLVLLPALEHSNALSILEGV